MNVGRYLFFVFCLSVLHGWLSGETNEKFLSLMNPKKDWSHFFNRLNMLCGTDTFVESGTYLGHTSAKAALCFDTVHTVELDDDFYRKSVENLSVYSNVRVYHGDTSILFHELVPQLVRENKFPLFWLDGHFMSCMPDTEVKQKSSYLGEYTPILKELQIIKKNNLRRAIVLIDDVRLFGTILHGSRIERAGNQYYPPLIEVVKLLTDSGFSCQIVGDILLGYPSSVSLQFSSVIKACTLSRLYDGTNYRMGEVLAAEQLIASTQGEELGALEELFQDFSMPWRSWSNKSPHYNLWYGLTLRNKGRYKEASQQFKEVISLGYDHLRVFWYLADSLDKMGDIKGAIAALDRGKKDCTNSEWTMLLQK